MKTPASDGNNKTSMKALVYQGPGRRAWEDRTKPTILQATDAVVRITTTTICGTDLHILKGDLPTVTSGRILGHEGVGIIEELGTNVLSFHKGDKVLISCITSCGRCSFCRKGMYSQCRTGGWILGNRIDGTQAEYVRIPYADTSLYALPPEADDEAATMLSDILPTGLECGVLNGQVTPGDIVAIVGAGPVGLAALLTAQLYSPAEIVMIDLDGTARLGLEWPDFYLGHDLFREKAASRSSLPARLTVRQSIGVEGFNQGGCSMLVLRRRVGESIASGNGMMVTILAVHGERDHLGIQAPEFVPLLREEPTYDPVNVIGSSKEVNQRCQGPTVLSARKRR
jgi:carbon storage regulator CsrA